MPDYRPGAEPTFIFIVTPPCSGSTALAKILCTSRYATLLHHKGEGQWLVPGLCEPDRWRADKQVNYESVRAVWLAKFQERKAANNDLEIVIEKSPPNIVRQNHLTALFKNRLLLANNRDPYANCASRLYRKYDTASMDRTDRLKALTGLAKSWLSMARQIRQLVIDHNAPLLTYEQFCQEPGIVLDKLPLPDRFAESINLGARVRIKDYEPTVIVNRNEAQVALLTDEELSSIHDVLHPEEHLLAFFGYSSGTPGAVKGPGSDRQAERSPRLSPRHR